MKILTIGGGNGHSNLLASIHQSFESEVQLSAIVSMSDDGRTTGLLMRYFYEELGIHFPPPGDLRRCLYALSCSPHRHDLEKILEQVIDVEDLISELSLGDILDLVGARELFVELGCTYLDFMLPIHRSIAGHKFGNIFMGYVFYNLNQDYDRMMGYMHTLLDVHSSVIPVTIDSAYIRATLGDGTVIERQDNISNVVGYNSRIIELSLLDGSHGARYNPRILDALIELDAIVIAPGDLYTSTISNLIIGGLKELIRYIDTRVIFIANNTNKGGETSGYALLDFILEIEKYLGKPINTIITNSEKLDLSAEDMCRLKEDISVKGGEYIYLTESERGYLESRGVEIVGGELIDKKTLYKHDREGLARVLEETLFSSEGKGNSRG